MSEETKKKISAREFHERMKARRNQPLSPEFIEKLNKIFEKDVEEEKKENQRKDKKTALSPVADL